MRRPSRLRSRLMGDNPGWRAMKRARSVINDNASGCFPSSGSVPAWPLIHDTNSFSWKRLRHEIVPSRSSIGTENPIPEEMDHREIAVRVPVMNEVQLLFPSEPRKPLKSRSLYVVFLVEKDVRVERRRTSNDLNHEEIEWQ